MRFISVSAAADGSLVFGSLFSPDWSGVAAVSPGGSVHRIKTFDRPETDQMGGSEFDGRWLVRSESHSPANRDDWDIWAWDSNSGKTIHVAAAPRVGGNTVPGPFILPKASRGKAAWLQANEAGVGEVHLYSLEEGRDSVLSAGRASFPLTFWGRKLLWAEKQASGQGLLMMADAITGERLSVPGPLAGEHSVATLEATDSVVAWADFTSVWVWRTAEPEARQIFTAEEGEHVDWVQVAGDVITWSGTQMQRAADLRSGSFTRLTRQNGYQFTAGNHLVLVEPPGEFKKESRPALETKLVDVTALTPLPKCM